MIMRSQDVVELAPGVVLGSLHEKVDSNAGRMLLTILAACVANKREQACPHIYRLTRNFFGPQRSACGGASAALRSADCIGCAAALSLQNV